MLKTKSVYSPKSKTDGLRILATRFRVRYMPTSLYDVWMPNLGPSEKLVKQFDPSKWGKFSRQYRKEIMESDIIDRHNATIKNHGQKFTLRLIKHLAKKGNVTLMCHCAEDQERCHRHILKKVILGHKI
jgi:uncharacterized protein YeaO (DUF488 family)